MTSDKQPAAISLRSAPDTLKTALHEHLRSIIEKPISTRMLLELEQAAALSGKLLVVSGENRAIPLGRQQGFGGGMLMEGGAVIGPADLEQGALPITNPLAPAAFGMPENFGAEAIRNMVADMQKPKLSDLMHSLEDAEHLLSQVKSEGDKDYYIRVVTKLRAQVDDLLGHDAPDDPATEKCLDCEAFLREYGHGCAKHHPVAPKADPGYADVDLSHGGTA